MFLRGIEGKKENEGEKNVFSPKELEDFNEQSKTEILIRIFWSLIDRVVSHGLVYRRSKDCAGAT